MNFLKTLLIVIVVVCAFGILSVVINNYTADVYFTSSRESFSAGKNRKALNEINKAIERNPYEPNYYRHRAKVNLSTTVFVDDLNKQVLKSAALDDLLKSLELNEINLATVRNNVGLYFFLANKDLSQASSPENIDENYIKLVSDYFKYAADYVPNDVGMQTVVARYQKRLLLEDDYKESVKRVEELRPDLLDWHSTFRE